MHITYYRNMNMVFACVQIYVYKPHLLSTFYFYCSSRYWEKGHSLMIRPCIGKQNLFINIYPRWVLLCLNKSWAEWVSHNEWAMWPFVLFCIVFEGTLYCNYWYIPNKLTCHIIYVLYLHDWKSASQLFWPFLEVRMKIFVGGPCPKKGLLGIYKRVLGIVYQHK